jgi:hypothetical protein
MELSDGNPDPARRQPRPYFAATTSRWDSANMPADTLWIGIDHNAGATAHPHVGYDALSNIEGRHNMISGPDVTVDAITDELCDHLCPQRYVAKIAQLRHGTLWGFTKIRHT